MATKHWLVSGLLAGLPALASATSHSATRYAATDTRIYTLEVVGDRGNPLPQAGMHSNYFWRSVVTASVDSVFEDYACLGWSGTGSVAPAGRTINTGEFILTNQHSGIVWHWVHTNSFDYWLADRNLLTGTPRVTFARRCAVTGVPHGFVYAFGDSLPPDRVLLRMRRTPSGQAVVETPSQDVATLPYVEITVLGFANMEGTLLTMSPAVNTDGKPDGRAWYVPDVVPLPDKAFFLLKARLK